ncbi:hypothetical protein TIFTF001_016350 [Ficus carica]|uniref:WD repeat-containing protein 76 n=1 Tax=Ficus carica TaxID=3494 RepID=A0AA88DIU0_FICCA|nr:hypothetical protein TIFTF001_016350 [Ficus carica]
MASSSDPTDYERKRLENIRRNDELMASLKLHSITAELSASTKRLRDEAKLSKAGSQKKPKSDQTPIVIRRSLRSRRMPPDPPKIPRYLSTSTVKVSPLTLGPISMKDAFREDGSDRTLTETLMRFGKKSEMNDWLRAKTAGDKSDSENMGGKLSGNEVCKGENLSDSVEKEENEVGGSVDLCSKLSPENVGEKFSGGRLCKDENLSVSVKKEDSEVGGSSKIVGEKLDGVRTCKGENLSNLVKKEEDEVEGSFDLYSMTLNPEHVTRILPDRIMHARFFPCSSSRILAEGNRLGDVGFWNLDHRKMTKQKMTGYIRTILILVLFQVFTSCYDGYIRSMDAEKEVFDLIYSTDGKMCNKKYLHVHRINSIDFNSDNPNILATGSSDGDVFIWDLRSIDANKPRVLNIFSHKRAVHSAYFSPSGKCLASTSSDNTVGIHGGVSFKERSMIHHNNQTGCSMSTFRAIWCWDDAYLFIGNMKRGVDVISASQRRMIFTLQSPLVSSIPCRFDAHSYHVGMLAGATGGGQVSVWTLS